MDDMSEPVTPPNPTVKTTPLTVKFVFERSSFYRSIHADGAWARLDPVANIHLTFFNEKPQLPVSGIMNTTPEGQWVIDNTKLQYAHEAPLVREVETDVILSIPAAVMVRDVLNTFLKAAMDNMQKAAKQAEELESQRK